MTPLDASVQAALRDKTVPAASRGRIAAAVIESHVKATPDRPAVTAWHRLIGDVAVEVGAA